MNDPLLFATGASGNSPASMTVTAMSSMRKRIEVKHRMHRMLLTASVFPATLRKLNLMECLIRSCTKSSRRRATCSEYSLHRPLVAPGRQHCEELDAFRCFRLELRQIRVK